MKKTRMAFSMLGIGLALSGCGAESAAQEPVNFLPGLLMLVGFALLALAIYQTYCYMQYLKKARRRRRKNTHGVDPLTIILYAAAAVLLLLSLILGSFGNAQPGDTTEPTDEPTVSTTEPTQPMITGWVDEGDSRYYMLADGSFLTGWHEMDGRLYYFQDNGMTLSGWHEVEDVKRYFRADGSMARGQEEIDGVTYFFTSTGKQVEVANTWNRVAEDYAVELMELSVVYAVDDIQIDVRIYEPLKKMMNACNSAMEDLNPDDPARCCVTSGYRSWEDQQRTYNNKVNRYLNEGMTQEEAERQAATEAALPGASEHQLGLAVDIVDTDSWSVGFRDDLPAQKWLVEHCWEYGFILRYPEDKSHVTGIVYEPWHFRYVGVELAQELWNSGLTLEEYLDSME